MTRGFFSSLRLRLLVLILLAIIPGFGLIVYQGSEQQKHEAFEVRRDLKRLARLAAGDHHRLVEGTYQLLVALARLPAVRGGDPATCSALLADLLKQYPQYANLGAAKPNGDVFCSAEPLGARLNVAGLDYFQRVRKTRDFAMGEYQIGHTVHGATAISGYPILDKAGRIQSVVFAALDLSWLNRFLAEAGLPRDSTLTVIDANGTILASHPKPEQWVGKAVPDSPLVKEITARGEGVVELSGLDDVRRLHAFTRLGGAEPGAFVSIGVSSEKAFAESNRVLTHTLLGLAVVAALALGAAWLGGDLFVLRRLNALVRATKRLGAGELSARAGLPYGRGEISELAKAFDEMAAALERHEIERKRAEEALRQSEERYRELVENANDIIYSHDMAGRFTSINGPAEQVTGYTREEALTMTIDQIITPEYLGLIRQVMERGRTEGGPATLEIEMMSKSGRRVALEVNPRPILQHGQIVGVQGIARDISERKRLEDQLRQAQKLEAVGLLAGGVAHDFNNLLNGIIGFAELALRELPAASAGHQYIGRIPEMGRRAADLVGQLLAFARKAPLERKPLDLNSLLKETAKMLSRTLPETLSIKVESASEPLVILADLAQVQQVLLNLATNARDAMPAGGALTLRLAPLTLMEEHLGGHPERRQGDFVCLTVTDTGLGIPAAIRERIFEPFFTTKASGQGTGLGLASVYGVVHQHEGWIEVESAEGEGSAFRVFFPRLPAPAGVTESPMAAIRGGAETILLVEDNAMVRELGEILLTKMGYTVITAADGHEGLDAFRAHPEVALVLSDAIMPQMGAAELIPALRAVRPDVKVLVATGYASEEVRATLDDLQPQGYIWKPFRLAELAGAIRAALGGSGPGAG